MDQSGDHPTPEQLATLAAPGSDPQARARLSGHLSCCAHCMGIYAEFVHAHARFHGDPQVAQPEPELISLGMAVAAPTKPTRQTRLQRRWLAPALTISSAAAVALVMVWRATSPPSSPSLSVGLRETLAVQVRHDSRGGLLYSDSLMPQDAGIRGPAGASTAQPDLEQLVALYNRDEPSADVAYWLVTGFLATNQVRSADPYLRESLQRFPSDSRFQNLAAILSYKHDELDAAEQHLRMAVATERSAVALVNLAIVRRQQGFHGEAGALLQEVQTRFPATPIAGYARDLLQQSAP
jgi:hypothetical protein